MELVFAYLAGLLTPTNPCVLPTGIDPCAPLALAAGMGLSLVVPGSPFGHADSGRRLWPFYTPGIAETVGAG